MLKDTIDKNAQVKVNSRKIELLKRDIPQCFDKDGKFDWALFEKLLKTEEVDIKKEGYSLDFLGKSYARYMASLDSETVIVPDEENKKINSQNVYIVGDNLDALQHLKYSYSGQVKCIYIDPPYNTGSDGFVYNDKFEFTAKELAKKINIEETEAQRVLDMQGKSTHSAWLTFMYPRLELARDLLSDDGIIFISVDDNEQANCKLLCDMVFGEGNFLTCISRATGTPTGGGFDGLVNELDYVLIYARNKAKAIINGMQMDDADAAIYDKVDKDGNRYLIRSLRRTGGEDRREDRPTMFFPLIAPDGTEVYPYGPTGYESRWICAPSKAKWLEENNLLEWNRVKKDGKMVWHPFQKYYLENRTKAPGNIWLDLIDDETLQSPLWNNIEGNKKATREIRDLFDGKKVFETAKPVDLLYKIISISLDADSLILDFFSGSATTAHAVMQRNVLEQINCKYIMVQVDEPVKQGSEAEKAGYKTIDEIGRERIRRAAKKIKLDEPEKSKGVDLGFKTYYLKSIEKDTLDKIIEFNPNMPLDDGDIKSKFGTDTILETWKIHDGYGFNADIQTVDLKGYSAYLLCDSRVGANLYLIDDMPEKAIIELVRKLEAFELNLDRIVEYGYSFSYTSNTALRSNLKTLKNIKSIEPIIRY